MRTLNVVTAARSNRRFSGDRDALAAALRERIRGEVRFDEGSRALYATDASNYREVPIGVVVPKSVEDVVETVATCRRLGAPILARGGGTSLAGQTCNYAVIMDFSKYLNRILELDPTRKVARVQPGVVLDDLRRAAEEHHLTFGPDPATHDHCTLGGMIGNDSCGVHSIMAGRTSANVDDMDVLTYDGLRLRVGRTSDDDLAKIVQEGGRRGEIYAGLARLRDRYATLIRERFPRIPRLVSGFALDQLLPENGFDVARALVGTEGTCVTVLEATARLVHSPPARSLVVLSYPDIFSAGDHVVEILRHGPIGLEALDEKLTEFAMLMGLHRSAIELLPPGGGWLLVEFGGQTKSESDDRARELVDALRTVENPPTAKLFDDPWEERQIWLVRESGLGATTFLPGTNKIEWPGWEDAAVPPAALGGYLRDFQKLLDKYGYDGSLYGHFGDGCVHTSTDFDLETRDGIKAYHDFVDEAADLVVRYGGSLSGEHGDGQSRGELLVKMFGPELVRAFGEFKAIWDPDGKMNPGKVVDPYPLDADLRLGTGYNPPTVKTYFDFPEEKGSFARATLRCVGVGECRKTSHGTMCPSYMVTREEKHSTRGRARLLFEMLEGNPLTQGWRSESVKEALDLCLSCKGCKGECPVNVDMATYKSEFLAHYYEGRLRPPSAYAFGLIFIWARLASLAPAVANGLTHAPVLRDIAKAAIGIANQRQLPVFASRSFKQWFQARGPRNVGMPRVILWADTFNNYFTPDVAIAAVEVLEAAGFQVTVPRPTLCCGRPLYDYGMVDFGKRLLTDILETLRPEIQAGVPIVGLEPSCVTVFRDELRNLFPNDENAKRLSSQSFLLSEFLVGKATSFQLPQIRRKAVVHGHCHQKAIMKMTDEESVLTRMGLDYNVLDSGCCGMAGGFGYEKSHYDVSIACGERILLPAVRTADAATLIVSDGFSCREQISQTTGRRAFHLAEVISQGLRSQPGYATADCAQRPSSPDRGLTALRSAARGMVVGGLLLASGLAWLTRHRG